MRSVIIALCFICATLSAFAQGTQTIRNRSMLMEYGDRFYADAYVVPNDTGDSATVVVFFRIANDMMSFVRVRDVSEVRGNYSAEMAVNVELRDTLGVIRQRTKWSDTAFTNTFEETNSKNAYHVGWTSFQISQGTYVLGLEVLSQKESNQKRIKLPPVSFMPRKVTRLLAPAAFGAPESINGVDVLRLFVFNSNLPFGPDKAQALLLVADSTETRYTYRIHQLPWDNKEIRWWRVSDIEGRVQSQRDRFPRISAASSNEAAFLEMSDRAAPRRPIASVEIPIPMATLVPGRYQIDLVKAGTRDTIAVKFQIVWEMMPFSLRTLDYAIESMQYICSEETLDSLTDGDAAQNRQALMEWWRRQDQTATTVYNERMAEYYRRVDNAFFAFSTINEPDGSRTERGKVYVLYGQPSSITKDLKASSPREIWKYTNVPKQTFTFEVNDRGVYRLVDVK